MKVSSKPTMRSHLTRVQSLVAMLNGASVLITDTRLSQKVKNIATLQFNNTSSTDLKLIEVKMTKVYLPLKCL